MLGFEKPLEGDYEIGRRRLEKEKKLRRGERERERESHILVGLERSIEAIVRGEIVIVVSTLRGWSGILTPFFTKP